MYWLPGLLILPYFILLLYIYRSLRRIKIFNASSDPVTFLSVVIACHDEENNLPALLNNIALQNYPRHLFEVIVVNDNSTDKTFEIASGFTSTLNFLVLENDGSGKKQALRTGIKAAKGELIITTDADCRMGVNWIKTISAFYEMNKPGLVICPVEIESTLGVFGRFQELEFMGLQGITAGSALSGNATMCNGANLAFARDTYLNHSGNLHDEINSGDDIFLLQSVKKEGLSEISWLESPDILATTAPASTLISFLRQRSRWISKGTAYTDRYTIILGIATFAATILQISYLIAWLINPHLIWIFLSILILKSVPDFLILLNTSGRYGKRYLMKWFLPGQIIYPFYVLSVVFYSLTFRDK